MQHWRVTSPKVDSTQTFWSNFRALSEALQVTHQHVSLASAELTIHYSMPAGENAGREWSPYLTWWSLCSGRTVKSRIEAEQNCQASQRGPHDRHFFFLGSLLQTLHNLHAPQNRHCPHLDCILPFYFSCVEQIFYILYTSQKIIKIRPAAFGDTVPWHPAPTLSLSGMFKIYILQKIKHTKLIVEGGECHAANSGNKPGSIEKGHSQQLQQFNLFKKAQINPDTIVKSSSSRLCAVIPWACLWTFDDGLSGPPWVWPDPWGAGPSSLFWLPDAAGRWGSVRTSPAWGGGWAGRRERLWMLKFWCDCWGL